MEPRRLVDFGPAGAPVQPGKQRLIGDAEAMPDLFDGLQLHPAHFGQRCLGQPRRHTDPQRPGGQLHQRPALVDFGPRQQSGDHAGHFAPRCGVEQRHQFAQRRQFAGAAMMRPDQRNGLAQIAHIVIAHGKQGRVHLGQHHVLEQGRLHIGDIERAGQHRQRIAAIRVRHLAEILHQRRQLARPRWRQRQQFQQLGKALHAASPSLPSPSKPWMLSGSALSPWLRHQ